MTNQSEARLGLRAYMKKHRIDPLDPREDLPVGVDLSESVPVRGSVHIATGRSMSRDTINRKFRFLRFF